MYSQREILLIPVPFTDLTSQKKRPVLVLSNSEYNTASSDLIVAAITSQVTGKPFEVSLNNEDMAHGTLKVNSCIRADKIYTLSQDIVVKKFGQIHKSKFEQTKAKINELIA